MKTTCFKNISQKAAAILLAAAMLCGFPACSGKITAGTDSTKSVPTTSANSAGIRTAESDAAKKDETVYAITNADGSVKKIIVSDWISNPAASGTIADRSILSGITNVKGDETYTMSSDNAVVWDAEGNDIYYQGTTDQALPVDMAVSYTLDGSPVTAEALAGKSGKVTMRFDYRNNQSETVSIDGKQTVIYVPYAMLTGMMLDNSRFINIHVTNGKLINDGNKTYVVGFAFPGMREDLGISEKDLDIPSYVEISADVTDFSLATSVTVATSELFSGLNSEKIEGKTDGLSDIPDQLNKAMGSLLDGSSKLYDGLTQLLNKSGELLDGVNKLMSGSKTLYDGTAKLNSGANDLKNGTASLADGSSKLAGGASDLCSGANQLSGAMGQLNAGASDLANGAASMSGGIDTLKDGLGTINDNSGKLKAGAESVFESLLNSVQSQLTSAGLTVPALTPKNYNAVLENVAGSLNPDTIRAYATQQARQAVTAQVTAAVQQSVTAQVTASVRANVLSQVLAANGMTMDQYNALPAGNSTKTAIDNAVNAQMASAGVQSQIAALVAQNMASESVKAQISALVEQNMKSAEVQAQIEAAVKKAQDGVASVKTAEAQLDGYASFYNGLIGYTAGVADAYDGSKKLSGAGVQLKNGAAALQSGAAQASSGAAQLTNGTRVVADGASALASGAKLVDSGAAQLANATSDLTDGALQLYNGLKTLYDNCVTLKDGVTQLANGSMQLSDGLKQFNKEGVQKIVNLLGGDIGSFSARLKAMHDVAEKYENFAGIGDGVNGSVRFVYRTDEISNK